MVPLTVKRSVSCSLAAKCLMVAATPLDWTPWMTWDESLPARRGSSLKLSKLRPPRGWRWMQTVGASRQRAPFECVSSARAWPTLYAAAVSNVAATQLAAGKHAAGVPPLKSAPRAPLGPSDVCDSCQGGLLVGNGTRCDCVYLDTGHLAGHFYGLPEVGTSEEGDLRVTS